MGCCKIRLVTLEGYDMGSLKSRCIACCNHCRHSNGRQLGPGTEGKGFKSQACQRQSCFFSGVDAPCSTETDTCLLLQVKRRVSRFDDDCSTYCLDAGPLAGCDIQMRVKAT